MRFKQVTAALCAAVLTITASGMVYAETDTSQGAVELMSEKVYIENPLGRWSFGDVAGNNQYLNCWLNTDSGSGGNGPGEGGASWWTGNDTLMLGGQRSKVWMNFGEPVSGGENFIVIEPVSFAYFQKHLLRRFKSLSASRVKSLFKRRKICMTYSDKRRSLS